MKPLLSSCINYPACHTPFLCNIHKDLINWKTHKRTHSPQKKKILKLDVTSKKTNRIRICSRTVWFPRKWKRKRSNRMFHSFTISKSPQNSSQLIKTKKSLTVETIRLNLTRFLIISRILYNNRSETQKRSYRK